MPTQLLTIKPTGRINRRLAPDQIANDEVVTRENMVVEGIGANRFTRKHPGADRFVTTAVGTRFIGLFRYYSKDKTATFGLNDGTLYHIDASGATTSKITGLSTLNYGHTETMRVSGNDVMFFVNGTDGMHSYDGNPGFNWKKETTVSQNFAYIVSHLDRLWGFEEDSEILQFSGNLNPLDYTSADSGAITIGPKSGKRIQAIVLLNETLYIFKEDSIFVLLGRAPSEFEVREITNTLGTAARFSVQNVETGIMFLGSDYEVWSFGGSRDSLKLESFNVALGGDLTSRLPTTLVKQRVNQIVAVFHNHTYRLSFVETGKTENNMEYCINTSNQIDYFTRDFNIASYVAFDKLPDINELYTGRYDTGLVMKMYEDFNVDNQATSVTMPYKLKTKSYRAADESILNLRFKRIWANLEVRGASLLPVHYLIDTRNRTADRRTEDFNTQGETVTVAGLKFTAQDRISSRETLKWGGSKGQSIQLVIDDSGGNIDLIISSFVIEVILKTRKRSRFVGV